MDFPSLGQTLIGIVVRFPAALASSVLLAVTFTVKYCYPFMGDVYDPDVASVLWRVALTFLLAVFLFLSVQLYFERGNRPHPFAQGAGLFGGCLFLLAYYHLLLPNLDYVAVVKYIATLVLAGLVFLVIPYVGRREGFEQYVIRLGFALVFTAFYSAALLVGIVLIVFTLNALLNLAVNQDIYLVIFIWVACVFSLSYFLSQLPPAKENSVKFAYPPLLRILLVYLVRPFMVVYMAILYYYFATILVTLEWPKGVVVNLVLWFSLLSAAVLFLGIPWRNENKPAKFERVVPILMLPLLAMLFAALAIRINAYGVTEERYYVGLLALWVTGVFKYFAFFRKPQGVLLAVVLAGVVFISVFGPFSAVSVAEYSQNSRLTRMLEEHGMLKDGQIQRPAVAMAAADRAEISRIIHYFAMRKRLAALRHLPSDFVVEDMGRIFGFEMDLSDYRLGVSSRQPLHFIRAELDVLLPIGGYDYWFSSQGLPMALDPAGPSVRASFNLESLILQLVTEGRAPVSIDFAPSILAWLKEFPEEQWGWGLSLADMGLVFEDQALKMRIVFSEVSGSHIMEFPGQTARLEMYQVDFDVFVDIK